MEQLYDLPLTTFISTSNPYGYDEAFAQLEEDLANFDDSSIYSTGSSKSISQDREVDFIAEFKVEDDAIVPVVDGRSSVPAHLSGDVKVYLCPTNCVFGQGILKGSTAIIRRTERYQDGAYVVVAVKGEPVTICRLYYQNNQCTEFILDYCDNHNRPKLFNEANSDNVKILGQILELRQAFEHYK